MQSHGAWDPPGAFEAYEADPTNHEPDDTPRHDPADIIAYSETFDDDYDCETCGHSWPELSVYYCGSRRRWIVDGRWGCFGGIYEEFHFKDSAMRVAKPYIDEFTEWERRAQE